MAADAAVHLLLCCLHGTGGLHMGHGFLFCDRCLAFAQLSLQSIRPVIWHLQPPQTSKEAVFLHCLITYGHAERISQALVCS